jgi:dolichol-phosphate mannosyltransferase
VLVFFALLYLSALLLLIKRLAGGRTRRPPEAPIVVSGGDGSVTIVVATLNEARRIAPLLEGVMAQGPIVSEILVVDSHSTDGTRALVEAAAARDARVKLCADPPLPSGWIGKSWALQYGLEQARSTWVLGLDADTAPHPGLADAVVAAANREHFDVVSFAPCFDGQTAAERFVQPALLVTLVYRFGAAGDPRVHPDRVMANGQCFLAKRAVLLEHGGYEPVKSSFAEDVSLARRLARRGVAVGFLDGSRLYTVRSYSGVREMWREWGRSLDLKNATTPLQQWLDVAFLLVAQGTPLFVFVTLLALGSRLSTGWASTTLLWSTGALTAIRLLLLLGIRGSYTQHGPSYWLSPLADPLAFVRILLSTLVRPKRWRTRAYW